MASSEASWKNLLPSNGLVSSSVNAACYVNVFGEVKLRGSFVLLFELFVVIVFL